MLEPVPREALLGLDRRTREAERRREEAEAIRNQAAEIIASVSIEVVQFLYDVMKNEDADMQARLRASEILVSRQIPKVAAKQVENTMEESTDSVDIQAIRDSILGEFKKRSR